MPLHSPFLTKENSLKEYIIQYSIFFCLLSGSSLRRFSYFNCFGEKIAVFFFILFFHFIKVKLQYFITTYLQSLIIIILPRQSGILSPIAHSVRNLKVIVSHSSICQPGHEFVYFVNGRSVNLLMCMLMSERDHREEERN